MTRTRIWGKNQRN